jgi:predicted dehydrogenase
LLVSIIAGYPVYQAERIVGCQRVGKITSVDFHWYLNTFHGADYFRRWHGERKYSGTLLLHKATHHFDLLNWWIDSDPVEVFCLRKTGALWAKP